MDQGSRKRLEILLRNRCRNDGIMKSNVGTEWQGRSRKVRKRGEGRGRGGGIGLDSPKGENRVDGLDI